MGMFGGVPDSTAPARRSFSEVREIFWKGLRANRLVASARMQSPVRSGSTKTHRQLATRLSLIERLADWKDQVRWPELFHNYWRLPSHMPPQHGLTDSAPH